MSMIGTGRALLGPWAGYLEKVRGVEPSSLIGLWLQNEQSGTISYDLSGQGNNGAYTGVTLGQAGVPGMGMTCPLFDGANDLNNIYSAALNADFSGAEGTLLAWAKVSAAGVWEDSTRRDIIMLYVDGSNYIRIIRDTANNTIKFNYTAGGTGEEQATGSLSNIDFACYAMTWSKSGEIVIYYIDGETSGVADTALGTWAGNLGHGNTVIGSTSSTPANVWSGNIGPVVLRNKALTAAQIAYLSKA